MSGIQVAPARIRETRRIIDDLVKPDQFSSDSRSLIWLGDPNEEQIVTDIFKRVFSHLAASMPINELKRRRSASARSGSAILSQQPPGPCGGAGYAPVEAWKEMLYLLTRFGHRVTLKKGDRLELQHVKVVVEKPRIRGRRETA